ncbi:TRAP transporter small permease subunit [Lentilitoribacter sp. Alg239-R112]|uniref:TRAP transporter small permease subunit n=1 Tax=Lentilitoribacter sp. Alg239-R112 TaxID=2305987 RepID=UPI0018D86F79|nr:TRAP transporter small permease subunit [Lentilitoribacter sp. Alg239-R112]
MVDQAATPEGSASAGNDAVNNTSFVMSDRASMLIRLFGWTNLAIMLVYLINNFLSNGAGFPGAGLGFATGGDLGADFFQFALYPIAIGVTFAYVLACRQTSLRTDSFTVSSLNAFFIRAAFWAVLFVGLADTLISFLRIEGFLDVFVSEQFSKDLGRAQFRGPYVHVPLIGLGVVMAFFTRTLGFHWLALLIVVAELLIVFSRFIFSYEQAFMSDLVRFWYGALFLFASAYTLLEEGHVRVDIFYAGFEEKSKGYVNAYGSVFLGISLCWIILFVGMDNKASIINSPLFNFETSQSGFGLYVKYLMAAFLGVFAISMMIQFVSYLFGAVADIRGEAGKHMPKPSDAH